MARIELLVIIAFAALVCGTEVDDSEQKKRGAGKTSLNTIPTGAQKQDFTYSIYSQNPSSQSPSYQPQVSNSFYPSQTSSQYYTAPVQQAEQPYAPQPQLNLLPPQTSSQFVPINFIPSPGYQSKYQIVPSKQNSNIQFAFLQQPTTYPSQSLVQYPQFAPQPTVPIGPHQNLYGSIHPQGQYNVSPNLPLQLSNSFLGQPSTMVLLPQPNPSLFNHLLYPNQYPNPVQNLYNYSPQNSQTRYNQVPYSSPPSDSQVSQSLPKEDNDISTHTSDYASDPSESNSSYKAAYVSSRSSYSQS
ncbi:Uncharacterized protein OBRU01_21734 [Operophtera brumata]|uniref:Uncharacterized protein n=1 Tax=Operophtera brumata TaxID=104452 RepID=A0A0L7KS68_OPEBR|nr:Uncharacterized protein OBRU01_21734 [Operophtera brumata]